MAVQGTRHQANIRSNGGAQCTIIAFTALIFASFILSPSEWTSSSVDRVLYAGDDLYTGIVDSNYGGDHTHVFGHDEVPHIVHVLGRPYHTNNLNTFYGIVGQETQTDVGSLSLETAVHKSLSLSQSALATFNAETVALVTSESVYYIYDSHARNCNGYPDSEGSAVLLTFHTLEDLILHLKKRYPSCQFELTPFTITSETRSTPTTVETNIQTQFSNRPSSQPVNTMPTNDIPTGIFTDNANCVTDMETQPCDRSVPSNPTSACNSSSRTQVHSIPNSNTLDQMGSEISIINHTYMIPFSSYMSSQLPHDHNHSYGIPRYVLLNNLSHDHIYTLGQNVHKKQRTKNRKTSCQLDGLLEENNNTGTSNTINVDGNQLLSHGNEQLIADISVEENYHDPMSIPFHNTIYESAIRVTPNRWCACCERFLFPNQCRKLPKSLDKVPEEINITASPLLCSTCYNSIKKGQVPAIASVSNQLHIDKPPPELLCLNKIERRLLSLIQVFFTVIILPGGQYAEKGLVLNLPVDISAVTSQISLSLDHHVCAIHFEAAKSTPASTQYLVKPHLIWQEFSWLKRNNHLYELIQISNDFPINSTTQPNVSQPTIRIVSSQEEDSLKPVDYPLPNSQNNNTPLHTITIPRSLSSPVSIYEKNFGEESAFPWLFPYGKYGFKHIRPQKISLSMYFRYRLYNKLSNWRKDMMYLLHAAASFDIMQLKSEIRTYLRMNPLSQSGLSTPITAGFIRNQPQDPFILRNSYMFMKHIRGTVAYFRNSLNNLLAMLRTLGPPTLFVTLLADDVHWPELGMFLENITYEDAAKRSDFRESMCSDPLITATHFERRFKALLKYVIKGPQSPLGSVQDYFVRVEFQNRGSAHYHMFFWIKDIPQTITNDTTPILIEYINQVIHTNIPDKTVDPELHNLVKSLQTHKHTNYCTPNVNARCRFNFPRPPCSRTQIFSNNNIIHRQGKFYEVYRNQNSQFINAYNPTLLRHFRSNMDIQLVNDAQSVAYYICSYICKSEPDDLRHALGNLIQNTFGQQPELSSYHRLWQIGTTVLCHRRMSSQEAAYKLSQLQMIQTSREILYLNVRTPDKRYKMLKPKAQLLLLDEDSTDIFYTNILDYYRARPESLEQICLYYFASWYQRCSQSTSNRNAHIYIREHNLWFRKRNTPLIIRYPNTVVHTEEYYYTFLILLLPHRTESGILSSFQSYQEAFIRKENILDKTVNHTHFSFSDDIDNAMRRIRLIQEEEQALIADNSNDLENENNSTSAMIYTSTGQQNSFIEIPNEVSRIFSSPNGDIYVNQDLPSCRLSRSELNRSIQSLTISQQKAFSLVCNHYNHNKNEAFYLFISGGGGVGKSFLINIIIAYLQHNHAEISGFSPVLICAPTGTDARNVHGQTVHSLLNIPVSRYIQYEPLLPYMLQTRREVFHGVHTLIIDEISMVSSQMLSVISRRLNEISGNDQAFGGFNMIVLGDLYQLRPVLGKQVFSNTILGHLFKPALLKENKHQCQDNSFVRLLNRARIGALLPQDCEILKSRLIDINNSDIPSALHLFPTRKDVDAYNLLRQQSLNINGHTLKAIHYFSSKDHTPGADVPLSLIPTNDHDAGNLPKTIQLSISSRVMLIRNVMTTHGLVNGAMGSVHSFQFTNNKISAVLVLFDDPSVGHINTQMHSHEPIPIGFMQHTFLYYGRSIVRSAIPLIQCWACTIHKVQGMTLDNIVIDIGNSVFEPGMAYVALSRVTSLQGSHLIHFNSRTFQPRDDVILEYARLRALDDNANNSLN